MIIEFFLDDNGVLSRSSMRICLDQINNVMISTMEHESN